MADGSVGVIVTSPPYNLGTSTGNGFRYGKSGGKWNNAALKNGYASYSDDMPDEAYVEWLKAVISECWRLVPDDGAMNDFPEIDLAYCQMPSEEPEVTQGRFTVSALRFDLNYLGSLEIPRRDIGKQGQLMLVVELKDDQGEARALFEQMCKDMPRNENMKYQLFDPPGDAFTVSMLFVYGNLRLALESIVKSRVLRAEQAIPLFHSIDNERRRMAALKHLVDKAVQMRDGSMAASQKLH